MRSWMIGVVVGYVVLGFAPGLPPGWMTAGLLIAAVLLARSRFTGAQLCCGIVLGLAGGAVYGYSLLDSRVLAQCEARPLWLEGEIISLPRQSRTSRGVHRQRFEFRPVTMGDPSCEGPRRLLLSYYGELSLHPAEYWRFSVKLKKPWGLANPGSFNIQAWYAYSGIDGTGNVRKDQAVLIRAAPNDPLNHHVLRQRISAALEQLDLNDDVIGILQALTVADKSGISSRLWTLLQYYGINHLLVISGLHVGIVAGAGFLTGGVLGRLLAVAGAIRIGGLVGALTALLFAACYAALAGFSLATVRALCMLACFVVASLFARGSRPGNNLLIAAVIVLLVNPLSGIGSGFWLSFSAVACLLWLGLWRVNYRLPLRLLHTHVYMALAMIPIGGWWFGGVSQVAALANFALIPLVGLFVVPIALSGVVAHLLGSEIDAWLWAVAGWPLEQLLPFALSVAHSEKAVLYSHLSPSPMEALLAIVALALLPIALPRALKVLILVLVLPIFLPSAAKSPGLSAQLKVTVLDVGQGTAVVVQSGGNTLVYDTGGGDPAGVNMAHRVVLPYLREQGVVNLQALIISHQDNDHSAGAAAILEAMAVEQVIVGGAPSPYPGARKCRAGQAWQWPSGVSFQILSPEHSEGLSSNNSSCVLQLHFGGVRLLLPGDIDARREKELVKYWRAQLHSELLLAAHHGSLGSSSYPWLKTVQAEKVLFSHGYLNQFGHPHSRILTRYRQMASERLSSATQGALEIIIGPSGTIAVNAYRASTPRYWM